MLYLKSLTLGKFKSFKNSSLLFSKGFTCIVGPNGSGKSNICDALLFGLGETSLHRLRVEKLESLINYSSIGKGDALQKAQVRIELDGDEKLEILRTARSDGKSSFRVNGKHLSRQEVLEILKRHKMNASETNTITQGEISKMFELNPKEKRELIEVAAGIKEYEDKKAEALKELDKVNARIGEAQIMLNERQGFLNELEKEKEAAEKYTSLSQRLKLLNYSILVARAEALGKDFDNYAKEMALADSEKQKLQAEIGEAASGIERLNEDAKQLTKKLSESTVSISDVNSRLEEINKGIATLEAEISGLQRAAGEYAEFVRKSNAEVKSSRDKMAANSLEIGKASEAMAPLEKIISAQGSRADLEETLAVTKIDEVAKAIEDADMKLSAQRDELAKIQAELQVSRASAEALAGELSAENKRYQEYTEAAKRLQTEIASSEKEYAEKENEIKRLESEASKAAVALKELETKLINLKEQRAVSYSRDSGMIDKIKGKFGPGDGFYGKASELCEYDSEYALAIEVAAGGRFDYLVVDSLGTAKRIIDYIKSESLGRATFIPLSELRVEGDNQDDRISRIIDFVKFEEKYRKAFEYIFSNTYIIGSIEDAKKYGISRHRYVTKGGELVEQSGVVSGGTFKARRSLAFIENQISSTSKEIENASRRLEEANSALFNARKDHAAAGFLLDSKRKEAKDIAAAAGSARAGAERREGELSAINSRIKSLSDRIEKLSAEIKDGSDRLYKMRNEQKKIYEESIEASKSIAKHGLTKAELEKVEKARKDLEALKIRKAELEKENQMLLASIDSVAAEIAEKNKAAAAAKKELSEKLAKKIELEKAKEELAAKIRESSEANKSAYEKLSAINAEIARLSAAKGEAEAKLENAERRFNDAKLRQSQIEVRLNDIKAEIAAYTEKMEPLGRKIEEMQKEADITAAKIAELGNVNLKAPELYAEKKRFVDEANEKLGVLDSERQAVLKMIDEVESKKLMIFTETFNGINKNFSKLYNYIFPGNAEIELDNPKDPFNSGLYMRISDGKNSKRLEGLSGGEKSLVMLMLIFAIHMYKPSSLYIFDEVDYALDKENSKKLSQLIKELSKDSQFIVVSHNDSLISNAEAAIGVATMGGESKAVGIEISKLLGNGKS